MPRRNNRLKPEESNAYRARLVALDLTQNDAARALKLKSGPFSRWIRGEFASAPNRKKLDTLLAREEAKLARRGLEPAMAGNGARR